MTARKILASATIGILLLVILVRTRALPFLFSANYLPHRYCYLAQPDLIWANVVMDGLIAASYVVIFACLFWIVAQLRSTPQTRAYLWVFVAFGVFIVACASTHLMEAGLRCGVDHHRRPFRARGAEDHRQHRAISGNAFAKPAGARRRCDGTDQG
jgi:hypothetical protein